MLSIRERSSLIHTLHQYVDASDLHALSDAGLVRLAERCGVSHHGGMKTHSDHFVSLGAIESEQARAFVNSPLTADSLQALSHLDPEHGAGPDDMRRIVYRWCERHGANGYLDWTPGDPASMRYVMWPGATAEGVRRIVAILGATDRLAVIGVVPIPIEWREGLRRLACEVLPDGTFRLYGLGQAVDFKTPAALFEYVDDQTEDAWVRPQ